MTLRDAAIRYAENGWRVFPTSRTKVPLVPDWPNVATTDVEQVANWWRANPRASIGFATGELVVIDLDGPAGLKTRRDTEAQRLEWPITLSALTGRREGGLHAYYRAPEGVEIRNCSGLRNGRGIGPGVDVRGKGGLVVLPPSPHKSGRPYKWLVRTPPVPLPAWMVEALKPPPPVQYDPGDVSDAYGRAALIGECEAVETAPDGSGNNTLNTAAFKLGRLVAHGALREGEVRDALLAAATRAGHPHKGAERTINSGIVAGMRRP